MNLKETQISSSITRYSYGSADPSTGVGADTDPRAFRRAHANIVLGYGSHNLPNQSTGNSTTVGETSAQPRYERDIGFYDQKGTIAKMKYSEFVDLVMKVRDAK